LQKRPPPTRGGVARRDRVLVDSGAWIALLRARDRHHEDADGSFRRALRERAELITTNLIVAEVHRFLLFHMGIRPAALFLERIDLSPQLGIEYVSAVHHQRARQWLTRLSDQVISYTDAVSFAVMEESACTAAISFDNDFVIAGFELWRN